MEYKFKIKCKMFDTFDVEYDTKKMGPLEEKCLSVFDWRVADLIYLFLDEEFYSNDIKNEKALLEYELRGNCLNVKLPEYCKEMSEKGVSLTIDEIKQRCSFVWEDYFFVESTGMTYDVLQFYKHLKKDITDPDELLFWTFRLCAWGECINPFPYTLYKGLIEGRFERFYDKYETEIEWFVVKPE